MRNAFLLSLSPLVLSVGVLSAGCSKKAPAPVAPAPMEDTAAAPAAAEPVAAEPPAPAPAVEAAPAPPPPPELKATAEDRLGTSPAGFGLKVGDRAPTAALLDVTGATVKLATLYAKGPTFVIFYRGGWCPFCNAQLHSLSEAKAEFDKRGVQLVAISVDKPSEEAKTQALHGVAFPMLSDPKLVVQTAFKIVHKTGEEEQKALAGYGIDLASYSGENHKNFATPAIFFIDKRGVIRFVHVDEDYQTRPSTAQMLAIADRLTKK
jgi:peroxiredoxin